MHCSETRLFIRHSLFTRHIFTGTVRCRFINRERKSFKAIARGDLQQFPTYLFFDRFTHVMNFTKR